MTEHDDDTGVPLDNLTHSLVGAVLGEMGWKRRTPLAMATLVIGANLPDVDGVTYFFDDLTSLRLRRGWTHGVLAMAVLPPALAGAMLAWDRFVRRRRRPHRPPARFGPLLLLSCASVLSHPLFDFFNTYGVRFLSPFSQRWFYGDALYIIDPWLWAVLAGGLLLSRRRERTGRPDPGLPARAAGALAAAYILGMFALGVGGRSRVARVARERGATVERTMLGPVAADPLGRAVVVDGGEGYRFGRLRWLPRFDLTLSPEQTSGAREPAARAAAATEAGRTFLGWARFPVFTVERTPEETLVWIRDARYPGRRGSWASVRIRLPADPGARRGGARGPGGGNP